MSRTSAPLAERQHLVENLRAIAELSPEDETGLLDLPLRVRDLAADTDIVREGDRPTDCCVVLTGFLCRYRVTAGGKRQIMSFHLPGEIPDLQSLYLKVMDHNLGTLAPSRVALVAHEAVLETIRLHPRIGAAFWRATLIDAAIFREWTVSLGRRSAHGRIAHLICELGMRFGAVKMADNNTFPMPMTQSELGDAMGLSAVHVNRTLMELRSEGLIDWRNGVMTVLDWDRLASTAEFDPTYLHRDQAAVTL